MTLWFLGKQALVFGVQSEIQLAVTSFPGYVTRFSCMCLYRHA